MCLVFFFFVFSFLVGLSYQKERLVCVVEADDDQERVEKKKKKTCYKLGKMVLTTLSVRWSFSN